MPSTQGKNATSPVSPPSACSILVIGGGPAGSYSAACLAQEGFSVTLLEAETFPRYHVGESMLPSMRHFLRFVDADAKIDAFGFVQKHGAAFKFNSKKREGFTNFVSDNPQNYSWNVTRAEADALILERARELGVQIFESHRVTEVQFSQPVTKAGENNAVTPASDVQPQVEGEAPQRLPVSATWKNVATGKTGQTRFDWLIDASGRNGVLSRALGLRKYNQSLKNVAFWGYWSGTHEYKHAGCEVQLPFFEALHDESGWAWFIPLHNGKTSIGVVMDENVSKRKRASSERKGDDSPILRHYLQELSANAPKIKGLIGEAKLVEYSGGPKVRTASDYSYSGTSYAGLNYRIVGDAGAFIDPFFSSGVHLALSGGLSAAATIAAAVHSDCTASEAAEWHNLRVGTSYTRFLMIVLSAYRQMRAQELPVLSDIDEDNFDRAFDVFRPVIQGEADVQARFSEDSLRRTIDFCTQAFEPASLEDWHKEGDNSHMTEEEASEEAKAKAAQRMEEVVAAKKTLRAEDMFHIGKFVMDKFNGLSIRLEKGSLGLQA
ncbi:FAD/NAD(P)-binding domain-containing protein [Macrolepiota fuliginosa MF-IS2]|uniref:FAD/NAD(P)-binding domain-containing protein n=1 Tax=Macrolepiota fuliginosa MF-IS2 TaxID=1400762 RepID=A0A9P5XIH9_9AGAR|nr:FAD/NAD(P)-binding domain-containing protein [Macrolepiota fuliginosa MF-IS2]